MNSRISRALPLGLQYNPSKQELIHLQPTNSTLRLTSTRIMNGENPINSSETINLLGIIIDHRFTFRQQIAAATTKTQHLLPSLQRMAFSRGASMESFHHMVTTPLSPTLTWGSEVWWTGARHIVDNMNPTYLRFAQPITGLPTHTRTNNLLAEARIPPVCLLLDFKSRNYGIHLLLIPDDHPNKRTF